MSKYFLIGNIGVRFWYRPSFWHFYFVRDNGKVVYGLGPITVYTGE